MIDPLTAWVIRISVFLILIGIGILMAALDDKSWNCYAAWAIRISVFLILIGIGILMGML